MKQSRWMSLVEAVTNVLVGYGVAVATQWAVFPLFGLHATLQQNLVIGLITPPVGTVLYVGCGVANIKLGELVKKLWPLVLVELAVLLLLVVFPAITLVPVGWFTQ